MWAKDQHQNASYLPFWRYIADQQKQYTNIYIHSIGFKHWRKDLHLVKKYAAYKSLWLRIHEKIIFALFFTGIKTVIALFGKKKPGQAMEGDANWFRRNILLKELIKGSFIQEGFEGVLKTEEIESGIGEWVFIQYFL